jgi:hypothetical protein
MRGIKSVAVAALAAGISVGDVGVAAAQAAFGPPGATQRRVARGPTRIEVTPNRRLVRLCEDWLDVEYRPSGTVIVPKMRCRWGYR